MRAGIMPNWNDMRTGIGYTEVSQNFSSPLGQARASENHLILPLSFNQNNGEKQHVPDCFATQHNNG